MALLSFEAAAAKEYPVPVAFCDWVPSLDPLCKNLLDALSDMELTVGTFYNFLELYLKFFICKFVLDPPSKSDLFLSMLGPCILWRFSMRSSIKVSLMTLSLDWSNFLSAYRRYAPSRAPSSSFSGFNWPNSGLLDWRGLTTRPCPARGASRRSGVDRSIWTSSWSVPFVD